jgi:putative peptide zinc metalloprotease protein
MNLSEALDAALPEMPRTRLARTRPPCIDPDLIIREDVLDGEPFVAVLQREKGSFFRFSPSQWQLAVLFDGVRSNAEVSDLYAQQTGIALSSADVGTFADNMEESGFWYKTPQERNLALSEKLRAQRNRRAERKSKIDLAHIRFSAWDPDRYLGWLDRLVGGYIYSAWCVLAVVVLFAFESTVFISKWNFIGPDIVLYYNFSHKSFVDLAQFWLLFLVLGFFHESAHGLTCKHYGGQVHSMGLMFLYLMPAFYVDVTEVWISATKIQRLATIIAGIWVEMVICGLGMIVWLNTLQGEWLHDFAYQIILITGIAVIVINLNPLIKLDGYYFLTEAIDMPDLKERSTAFLTGWFQSHILRLHVETPVVPRSRAPFYILYAIVSGTYSYAVLFVVVRLTYNVTSNWLAEFALIPAGALAFLIFRSRLRALRGVIVRVWNQFIASNKLWQPVNICIALLLLAILFTPIWRDRENAFYVIEPQSSTTVYAAIEGRVNSVLVYEGEVVHAGEPLLRMESPTAASMQSSASADIGQARFQAVSAELHGQSIGPAAVLQTASFRSSALASEALSSLTLIAPADGIVLTHDPASLLDRNVGSGQELLDLANVGPRLVRVYIPISDLQRIPLRAEVAIALPDRFSIVRMPLSPLGGEEVTLPAGLIAQQDYKGIKLPVFYCARMTLPSYESTMIGISGQAKVFGTRRSIAGRISTGLFNLLKAHAW